MSRYKTILTTYFKQQNTPMVDVVEWIREATDITDKVMVDDLSEDEAKQVLDHIAKTDTPGVVNAKETVEAETENSTSSPLQQPGNSKFHKKLNSLSDEHDLHGDLQWQIGKKLSLSGKALLFEFYSDEDAEEIYKRITTLGVPETLALLKDPNSTLKTQNSKLNTQNSKLNTQNSTIEVYNAESGKLATRTPEQQAKGRALYQRFKLVDAFKWALVKLFLDGDHHLDVGYTSKLDFYQTEFKLTPRTVERYLKAGEILLQTLPVKVDDSIAAVKQIEGLTEDQATNFYSLADLGSSKLYELSKAEEADYSEVLSDGLVKFSDGREVPVEEFARHTRNEVQALVKDELDKYKVRNKELLEQRQKVEADLKKATEEMDANEERYSEAQNLERVYGPKALSLNGHYGRVESAHKAVREANKLLSKIELPKDAPEDLREQVVGLHRMVDGGRQILYDNNRDYIRTAKEIYRPSSDEFNPDTGEMLEEES